MSDLVIEQITLEKANLIIKNAIDKAREIKINPIMVVLLDHRGAIKGCSGEDGISSLRFQIAHGKANGAFQMGMGSRALFNRAEQQAYFINAVNTLTDGALVAVPGGVLIRDKNNNVAGSLGISGDTSDNDEIAAVAGIEAAGYKADVG
ncbi:MAG: heme-binding protein [Alphaproteobacteria bacterium]|nr:heme-binding protein [Alphaproteobacteria bacterium]